MNIIMRNMSLYLKIRVNLNIILLLET